MLMSIQTIDWYQYSNNLSNGYYLKLTRETGSLYTIWLPLSISSHIQFYTIGFMLYSQALYEASFAACIGTITFQSYMSPDLSTSQRVSAPLTAPVNTTNSALQLFIFTNYFKIACNNTGVSGYSFKYTTNNLPTLLSVTGSLTTSCVNLKFFSFGFTALIVDAGRIKTLCPRVIVRDNSLQSVPITDPFITITYSSIPNSVFFYGLR